MARQFAMTWVEARKGWMKKHNGKMYSVSAKQLGCTGKSDSWQAANQWWADKLNEIGEAPSRLDPSSTQIVNLLETTPVDKLKEIYERGQAALTVLRMVEGNGITNVLTLEDMAQDGINPRRIDSALRFGRFGGSKLDDETRQKAVGEVAFKVNPKPASPDRIIKAQVHAWLAVLRANVANGNLSAGRYGSYDAHIRKFSAWLGDSESIDILTNDKIEGYWLHLSERINAKEVSKDTARLSLMTAKQWVNWLASEKELIPYPGALRSKRLHIPTVKNDPKPFSADDVRQLLAACEGFSERTKLYLLLMANCGMYQSDISDLGTDEVDWKEGRIIRYRSKTGEKGRKISYPLWAETLALLKQFRWTGEAVLNDSGKSRVLLTERGEQLTRLWIEEVNGTPKQRRYDTIQSAYTRLVPRCNVKGSLEMIRKGSSTLLSHSDRFADCADLFLAHAPQGVRESSYTPANQAKFDKAIAWLGKQYGLA
jgi:integrase